MPMIERIAAVHSRYRPEELTLLLDYLGRCTAVMHESAAELAVRAARERAGVQRQSPNHALPRRTSARTRASTG